MNPRELAERLRDVAEKLDQIPNWDPDITDIGHGVELMRQAADLLATARVEWRGSTWITAPSPGIPPAEFLKECKRTGVKVLIRHVIETPWVEEGAESES